MNKSNIKFLALLSALASCTPALGAMKNTGSDNLRTNMIKSDYLIKKPVGSYQKMEKIDTFGTPELDLEAFLRSLNDSYDMIRVPSNGQELIKDVNNSFNDYCSGYFKTPSYKLEWHIPFVLSKVSETDNSTVRFVVRHKKSDKEFNIVGKRMTSSSGGYYSDRWSRVILGNVWHFYAENFQSKLNNEYIKTTGLKIINEKDYSEYLKKYAVIENMGMLRFFTRGLPYNKIRTMVKPGDRLYDKKGSGGYNSHSYLIKKVEPNSDGRKYAIGCGFRYRGYYKTYAALSLTGNDRFYNFENIMTTAL